jgi:hypothetical protein
LICRFSPTRTPSPWDGIKIADEFSPVCPQRLPKIQNETAALEKMPKGRLEYLKRLLPFLQNQSEDCLYLNIFSPAHGKSKCVGFIFHHLFHFLIQYPFHYPLQFSSVLVSFKFHISHVHLPFESVFQFALHVHFVLI